MKKQDLIKRILELGKELESANGFHAVTIINDMEIAVENYTRQLPKQNIIGQQEPFICGHVCDWKSVGYPLNGMQECKTCGKTKPF